MILTLSGCEAVIRAFLDNIDIHIGFVRPFRAFKFHLYVTQSRLKKFRKFGSTVADVLNHKSACKQPGNGRIRTTVNKSACLHSKHGCSVIGTLPWEP